MDTLDARLIPGTEENLTNPFFSPDGRSVGFWSSADAQLKRIPLGGGAPVPLGMATNPHGASWTVDGTIIFGQPEGVMRVSESGGVPELIIKAEEGEHVDRPQVLPGGE